MERESSAENERDFFSHSQGASIPPKLIKVMFKMSRFFEAPFYCRQMRQFVGLSSSSLFLVCGPFRVRFYLLRLSTQDMKSSSNWPKKINNGPMTVSMYYFCYTEIVFQAT